MDLQEEIQDLIAISYVVSKLLDDVVSASGESEEPVSAQLPIIKETEAPVADDNRIQTQMFDNSRLILQTYIVKPEDVQPYADHRKVSPANSLEDFQRIEEKIAKCMPGTAAPAPQDSVWSKSWHEHSNYPAVQADPLNSIHNPWAQRNPFDAPPVPVRAKSSFCPVTPTRRQPFKMEDGDPSRRKRSPSGGAKTILAHIEEERQDLNNQIASLQRSNTKLSEDLNRKCKENDRLVWEIQSHKMNTLDPFIQKLQDENAKLLRKLAEKEEKAILKEQEIEKLITEQDNLLARITELIRQTELDSNSQIEKLQEMELKLEISEKTNDELKRELMEREIKLSVQEDEHQKLLHMQSELVCKVGEVVRSQEISSNSHNLELVDKDQRIGLLETRNKELELNLEQQNIVIKNLEEDRIKLGELMKKMQETSDLNENLQNQLVNKDMMLNEHEEEKLKLITIQTNLLGKVGDLVKTTESSTLTHNQKVEELEKKLSEAGQQFEYCQNILKEKEDKLKQIEEENKKYQKTQTELMMKLGEFVKKSESSASAQEQLTAQVDKVEAQLEILAVQNEEMKRKLEEGETKLSELEETRMKSEEMYLHKISDLETDNNLCAQNGSELSLKIEDLSQQLFKKNEAIVTLQASLGNIINDVPTAKEMTVIRSYVHPEILKRTIDLVKDTFEKHNLLGDDAARYVSNNMDSLFGEHWQAVLYRQQGHGCFVYHNNNCFICFQLGSYHLVLFKY